MDGAVAGGCVDVAPPTAEPGCCVGFSVPAAWGTLFAVFGVDSLELPAGGLCVVVSGFCANAGAAAKIASAAINVFITGVPSSLLRLEAKA